MLHSTPHARPGSMKGAANNVMVVIIHPTDQKVSGKSQFTMPQFFLDIFIMFHWVRYQNRGFGYSLYTYEECRNRRRCGKCYRLRLIEKRFEYPLYAH